MHEDCPSKSPRFHSIDRTQIFLRTTDVESLIPEDHPARAIWLFLSRLDLSRFSVDQRAVEDMLGDLRFLHACCCRSGFIHMREVSPAHGRSVGIWSTSRVC